jgi:hypothetical protein
MVINSKWLILGGTTSLFVFVFELLEWPYDRGGQSLRISLKKVSN